MSIAVVGCSGGMKGVFIQGVLNALETGGLYADAYAGASASALPAAGAVAKLCNFVGIDYWRKVQALLKQPGNDLSHVMRILSREWASPDEPFIRELFQPERARLIIPVNYVKDPKAATQTQSKGSRRLGRKLLLDIARKTRAWVDVNLELHLYDTHGETHRITPDNLMDAAYASLRMLHWTVPAWIDGKPYVDASYTCACPVPEMVALGYSPVIAIWTEAGPLYRDIFGDQIVPDVMDGVPIHVIRPDMDLTEIGVDFTQCSDEGLGAAFRHGEEKGREFLAG